MANKQLCVDGKKHSYKTATIGSGQYGKNYYEKLKVIVTEETYLDYNSPKVDDKYVEKKKKVEKTVDITPGKHYQTIFCSGCGQTMEIVVKDHGPDFEKHFKGNTGGNS